MTIEVAVLVLLSGSKERKRGHNENMFKTKVVYNQAERREDFFSSTRWKFCLRILLLLPLLIIYHLCKAAPH